MIAIEPGRLKYLAVVLALNILSGLTDVVAGETHMPRGNAENQQEILLGSISFPTSASGEAQHKFEQGVLALHSFWYTVAREYFLQARDLDPAFGMTYWGEAMSYDNPALAGTAPASEDIAGAEVIARINRLDQENSLRWSVRERGFADAVRERFNMSVNLTVRRERYAGAMYDLLKQHPQDDEVIVFHALSVMSLHSFDKQLGAHVVSVAAPLEEVFIRNRDHPGVLHYLIHVYDTPTFAPMGLRAALLYARVAPDSSHAQHMPSHIFRQLGMWEEVVKSNVKAYQVSVDWQERNHKPVYMRDFHAFDWLVGAYLRLGQIADASKLIEEIDRIESDLAKNGEDPGQEFRTIVRGIRIVYDQAVRGQFQFRY